MNKVSVKSHNWILVRKNMQCILADRLKVMT